MIKNLNYFCKISVFGLLIGMVIASLAHKPELCTLLFGIQIACAYTAILTEEV